MEIPDKYCLTSFINILIDIDLEEKEEKKKKFLFENEVITVIITGNYLNYKFRHLLHYCANCIENFYNILPIVNDIKKLPPKGYLLNCDKISILYNLE